MSPYDHQDQRVEWWMLWGWRVFIGCVAIVTLVVAGRAGVEAYQILTNPPTYCVPSNPRI